MSEDDVKDAMAGFPRPPYEEARLLGYNEYHPLVTIGSPADVLDRAFRGTLMPF